MERALARAVTRFCDGSATGVHMLYHLAIGEGAEPSDRQRAQLVLAVAAAEGGTAADALDAACAVEILHEYAMAHDEIADGGRQRCGRDTIWTRFGLAHGINAGDALCAVAYLALLDGTVARPAERTAAMTRTLLEAQLALCGGQAREIAYRASGGVPPEVVRELVAAKAGALFAAAAALGALSAGATEARAAAYARMGECFGIARYFHDGGSEVEVASQLEAAAAIAVTHAVDRDASVRAFFAAGLQRV